MQWKISFHLRPFRLKWSVPKKKQFSCINIFFWLIRICIISAKQNAAEFINSNKFLMRLRLPTFYLLFVIDFYFHSVRATTKGEELIENATYYYLLARMIRLDEEGVIKGTNKVNRGKKLNRKSSCIYFYCTLCRSFYLQTAIDLVEEFLKRNTKVYLQYFP